MLWSENDVFQPEPFVSENELEAAIRSAKDHLFGPSRFYLEVKKKIGIPGKKVNIPDGYLIDLSSNKQPLLYVVENELASHDPLRHIAVQILEFSLSFEATPQLVKSIVRGALENEPHARQKCEAYAAENKFENLDYLLEHMIYRNGFQAIVIIDELEDGLETVLVKRFKFGVEVLTLERFVNIDGKHIYRFEPFQADVIGVGTSDGKHGNANTVTIDPSDIDTIVVPAREEGFQEVALGEQRWRAVRIHGSIIPKLKHIAVYRVAPVSAITHIAPIQAIQPWENSGKYMLTFAEPLQPVNPIKLVSGGKTKAPQSIRYTSYERLLNAKNLDEAF